MSIKSLNLFRLTRHNFKNVWKNTDAAIPCHNKVITAIQSLTKSIEQTTNTSHSFFIRRNDLIYRNEFTSIGDIQFKRHSFWNKLQNRDIINFDFNGQLFAASKAVFIVDGPVSVNKSIVVPKLGSDENVNATVKIKTVPLSMNIPYFKTPHLMTIFFCTNNKNQPNNYLTNNRSFVYKHLLLNEYTPVMMPLLVPVSLDKPHSLSLVQNIKF